MLANASLDTFRKGEIIFDIGSPPGITGIVTGSGIVTVVFEKLGSQAAHILHAGSWVGAASVIRRAPRTVAVSAVQNCTVVTVDLDGADRILAESPEYWRWFGLSSSENQRISVRAAEALLHRDPAKKLVATLLRLVDDIENKSAVVELPINQSLLSEMSNLSRGFVSGSLSKFDRDGLIEKRYGSIAVLDRAKLAAVISD
jgi:CRP-like cAMP-binding protein